MQIAPAVESLPHEIDDAGAFARLQAESVPQEFPAASLLAQTESPVRASLHLAAWEAVQMLAGPSDMPRQHQGQEAKAPLATCHEASTQSAAQNCGHDET